MYKDLLFIYRQPSVRIRKTSLFWVYNLMTSRENHLYKDFMLAVVRGSSYDIN